MELEHNSLKQSLTNHIKKINFNGGTNYFLNHVQSLQNKHQNNSEMQHLSNIHTAINSCTSEINTTPMNGSKKMRGFDDVPSFVEYMISSYLYNIQDVELLLSLLSFFEPTTSIIQNILERVTKLEKTIENIHNMNSLQCVSIQNIEENSTNTNYIVENIDSKLLKIYF